MSVESKALLMRAMRNISGVKNTLHEGRMAEVDQIMQDVASGELDCYTVMNHPTSPEEQYAANLLQQKYDEVATDNQLHPDDQHEEIIDIICDQLAQEYGQNDRQFSAEAVRYQRTAGMLTEAKAADEPAEPNETAIAKRKRLQAIKDKLEDERMERGEEEKKPASAVRKVQGRSYGNGKEESSDDEGSGAPAEKKEAAPKAESKPAASGGSFSSIAKTVLKAGGGAAAVKAALEKAGVAIPAHMHSRLHALKKNLKESFYVITHPQMPTFVLAENGAMNQYQWISAKDYATALEPIVFETVEGAEKVIAYMHSYKNQGGIVTKLEQE